MRKCLIVLAILFAVTALVAITDLPPPAAEVSQNYCLYKDFGMLHGPPGAGIAVNITFAINPDTTPTELPAIAAAANGSSFYSNCMPVFYWYEGDRPATSRIAKLPTSNFALNTAYECDSAATMPEVVDLRRQDPVLL